MTTDRQGMPRLLPAISTGDQGLELRQLDSGRISRHQSGDPSDLVDKREQRAVLAIGRTEVSQPKMRLDLKTLFQYCSDSRFAEAGFAGDQHDLALPRLGVRPTAQ